MNEPATEMRDFGAQPIDTLMQAWQLTNHDMVLAAIPEQLTHKQVQRARNGRRLTLAMMQKMARVLNEAVLARLDDEAAEAYQPYMHKDLFTYAKGYEADRQDPNAALYPQ